MYGAPDVIDHAVMSLKDREEALRRSREIWDSMYPKEPFDVDLDYASHDSSKKIKQFTSRLSYDLEAAIRRQRMFFYQVKIADCRGPRENARVLQYIGLILRFLFVTRSVHTFLLIKLSRTVMAIK